jgi:predicted nucleotidyltransferase
MAVQEKLHAFVDGLTRRDDVLAVVLFGSRARGDARPDSDIDLLVILRDGFRRSAEYVDGQAFELVWVTERGALEFWGANPEDAVALWQVAKVLYDRDGTGARLRRYGEEVCAMKPPHIAPESISHLQFDAEDTVRAVAGIGESDPATAALVLHLKIAQLTETFFRLRGAWPPPPKQRLAALRQQNAALATLLERFYAAHDLAVQIDLARLVVARVFAVESPG